MNIHDYDIELSPLGFYKLVEEISRRGHTQREAYHIAEDLHEQAFKKNRYASFEAFKVVRYRFLKRERKQSLPTTDK